MRLNDIRHKYNEYVAKTVENESERGASHRKTQGLFDHSILVGCLSYTYALRVGLGRDIAVQALKAGLIHDVGKILFLSPYLATLVDPNKPIKKAKSHKIEGNYFGEKEVAHNELSWLAALAYNDHMGKTGTSGIPTMALNAIYYHHAVARYAEAIDYSYISKGTKDIIRRILATQKKKKTGTKKEKEKKNEKNAAKKYLSDALPLIHALDTYCDNISQIHQGTRVSGSSQVTAPQFDKLDLGPAFDKSSIPSFFEQKPELEDEANVVNYISSNAASHTIRSCLVAADRHVSAVEDTELIGKVVAELLSISNIDEIPSIVAGIARNSLEGTRPSMLSDFESFSTLQIKKAHGTRFEALTAYQTSLPARFADYITTTAPLAAGIGKTRAGLNFLSHRIDAKGKRQVFWVCPRNAIAIALGRQIPAELAAIYGEDHDISVEVYLTGKRQETYGVNLTKTGGDGQIQTIPELCANIVITNIDTLLKGYHNHNVTSKLMDFIEADIVFDEPHEFVADNPLFFGFLTLMYARHNFSKSRSILLTATPLPFHHFWTHGKCGKNNVLDSREFPHWNDGPINLRYSTEYGDFKNNTQGFNILSSVRNSIRHHCQECTGLILHGRFHDDHKRQLVETVLLDYSKHSAGEKTGVSSALMLQAAMDISAPKVVESLISPIKTIQVLGRTNRFGSDASAELVCVDLIGCENSDDFIKKVSASEKKVQELTFTHSLGMKWAACIKEFSTKRPSTTKQALSDLYHDFLLKNESEIHDWLISLLAKSLECCEYLPPLQRYRPKKGKDKDTQFASSGNMRQPTGSWFATAQVHERTKGSKSLRVLSKFLANENLISVNKAELNEIVENLPSDISQVKSYLDYIEKRLVGKVKYEITKSDLKHWKKYARSEMQPIPYIGSAELIIDGEYNYKGKKYIVDEGNGPGLGLVDNALLIELGILTKAEQAKRSDFGV